MHVREGTKREVLRQSGIVGGKVHTVVVVEERTNHFLPTSVSQIPAILSLHDLRIAIVKPFKLEWCRDGLLRLQLLKKLVASHLGLQARLKELVEVRT